MYINITRPYKDSGNMTIELDNISINLTWEEQVDLFKKLDEELNDGYTREVMDEQIQELRDEVHFLRRELNLDSDENTEDQVEFDGGFEEFKQLFESKGGYKLSTNNIDILLYNDKDEVVTAYTSNNPNYKNSEE